MGESGKVSGRGGWKTRRYAKAEERELNKQEKEQYKKYCEYCERIGCKPASEHRWCIVNPSV